MVAESDFCIVLVNVQSNLLGKLEDGRAMGQVEDREVSEQQSYPSVKVSTESM